MRRNKRMGEQANKQITRTAGPNWVTAIQLTGARNREQEKKKERKENHGGARERDGVCECSSFGKSDERGRERGEGVRRAGGNVGMLEESQ